MRRKPGDNIGQLRLQSLDGTWFDVDQLGGKRFMLSFFRFAPARSATCGSTNW